MVAIAHAEQGSCHGFRESVLSADADVLRNFCMMKPQVSEKSETSEQFWHHYLRDHARSDTRLLHLVGAGLAIAALVLGIVTIDPMIAVLGIVLAYVFSWSGHFLIERNRPSMLAHPGLVVSVRCAHAATLAWRAAR
jgi:hypothetical protein